MRPRHDRGTDQPAGDDIIELEFVAQDVQGLLPASTGALPREPGRDAADRKLKNPTRLVGACAVISVAVGSLIYRPASPSGSEQRHTDQAAAATQPAQPTPELVVQQSTPVRLKNPFDASEVFEFPAGTSRSQARQLVQAMLLERARERQSQWRAGKRRNKQRASGTSYS
jgi:hypothetical protein